MSPSPAHRLHGEIESPRPLRAREGFVSIPGWCLAENLPDPPPVRLTTPVGILPMTARTERTDVPLLLPGQPAAGRAGFAITGRLPAGVHLARFEAQLPDGSWQLFKTLSLAVDEAPFAAAIESPTPTAGVVNHRVLIEGWVRHPTQQLRELAVRYGHQEIPCSLGGDRPDVTALHPGPAPAQPSGFRSRLILHAGQGALRLKAKLADGSMAVARTTLSVAIPVDENHGADVDFGAARIALPGHFPASHRQPVEKTITPRRILFILPGSFASNSALHVAALANELCRVGHACAVAVPHDVETLSLHAAPAFRGLTYAEADHGAPFPGGLGPDLIHAWTTRENVRTLAEKLRVRHRARVVVHLEDNERQILAHSLGRDITELENLPAIELDQLVPADLSHPRRAREFLAAADGVTVITDRLREFVPAGKPCLTVWPAADARFYYPRPRPEEFRRVLDRTPGESVLFYHGNVHASNAAEVRELYAAVLLLNRTGTPVTLVRAGLDQVNFLGAIADAVAPHVLSLGQIPHHHHLPPLMALADIFVQPGVSDAFNDYRFPSKLPEFFALGRPVVLPRTNLGTVVRHGVDAYVLERADAAGIATAVTDLRQDQALHDRLSRGAAAFAARNFNWQRSAEALAKFHLSLATSGRMSVPFSP